MRSSYHVPAIAVAGAFVMAVVALHDVRAQSDKEYVPKAKVTPLVQKPLAGFDGKDVIIRHFELPANYEGEKHWHPGPVFVYVLDGELTIETEDGVKTFKAGELYEEPLERPLRARNLSTTTPLKLVVFQVGDTGKPMMFKAD